MPKKNPLIDFYSPSIQGTDFCGRSLNEILSWPNSRLESVHDYIQILFPLPEGSPINWQAPIIDKATFTVFWERKDLRDRLRLSFERILDFYGFEVVQYGGNGKKPNTETATSEKDSNIQVIPSDSFPTKSRRWLTRFDHNHLRITRIIRSLRVLGLESEASAFFKTLTELPGVAGKDGRAGKVSATSVKFWTRAATRPLHLAPEDEGDQGVGKGFLYDFERARRKGGDGEGNSIVEESKAKV
ncbi:MAG: hypothetical protein M1827_005299 [Pycnora praestabilis]|nr:MAG: hypothetical protein M1827_005299 [Pycnora praestabilis]